MKRHLDERELVVLECLRDATGPIGSWSLVESLEARKFKVSSASIGRILYSLEQRSLVEGKGNQGRVITKNGLQAIRHTKAVNSMNLQRENLETLINSNVMEEYIMVLQARKAIERETVRLAAGFFIAAGHEGDGIALSPITGRVVADLVERKKPEFNLEKLDPARFLKPGQGALT